MCALISNVRARLEFPLRNAYRHRQKAAMLKDLKFVSRTSNDNRGIEWAINRFVPVLVFLGFS
jgi:hypothetical protein